MNGQRIGYIRVSTFEQNVDRQLDGLTLDKVFIDKASGKDTRRPELEALLQLTAPTHLQLLKISFPGMPSRRALRKQRNSLSLKISTTCIILAMDIHKFAAIHLFFSRRYN